MVGEPVRAALAELASEVAEVADAVDAVADVAGVEWLTDRLSAIGRALRSVAAAVEQAAD